MINIKLFCKLKKWATKSTRTLDSGIDYMWIIYFTIFLIAKE